MIRRALSIAPALVGCLVASLLWALSQRETEALVASIDLPQIRISNFHQCGTNTCLSCLQHPTLCLHRIAPSARKSHHNDNPLRIETFTSSPDISFGVYDDIQTLLTSAFQRFIWEVAAGVVAIFMVTLLINPLPSLAANYGSLTDEQKIVAEAWRLVDNSFLDRTFHGQDWFQLRNQYVKKRYKSMADAQSGIADMISTLGDKYTRYLPPAKYQSLVDSATGTLAGVGIELTLKESSRDNRGELRVVASDVQDQSPAQKAGIQPGDVFMEVDGTRFDQGDESITPDDVALKLRGPQGSKVGLVMERNGKTLDYILTRQPITITSVSNYVGGSLPGVGKVGVIRIKSFSATTAPTVKSMLTDLKSKGCSGFVIDCRGNPGGLLPGGVDAAALFLDENKPIVFVVNKNGVIDAQSTLAPGLDIESPLVVLVDAATASAAEVFTAALKENGRAVIAGQQTYGKGIVQTIRSLSDNNGGVAITVARYETPQHHDINQLGISVTCPTPVDCAKNDALACVKASTFQAPPLALQ